LLTAITSPNRFVKSLMDTLAKEATNY